MAKDKVQNPPAPTAPPPAPADKKAPKPRKPRKDGKPHPPEGMRYNRNGDIVPKIPAAMRGYYVIVGLSRRTNAPQIVCKFKSSKRAREYATGSMNLLTEAYSVVSINKMRLFETVFGG